MWSTVGAGIVEPSFEFKSLDLRWKNFAVLTSGTRIRRDETLVHTILVKMENQPQDPAVQYIDKAP